jgi:hypothetical protein
VALLPGKLLAQQQNFSGVIQYLNGEFTRQDPKGISKTLQFKDVIGEKDKIRTVQGPHLKIVTKNRCVLVLHEGELTAPDSESGAWVVNGTLRAICPTKQVENLSWNGLQFKLRESEVFFKKDKMFVIKDLVLLRDQPIKRGIYAFKNGRIAEKIEMSPHERFELNTEFGTPSESVYYGMKEPEVRVHSRWSLGLSPLGIASVFHSTGSYSLSGGPFDGVRLLASFASGDDAWLFGLSHREVRNSWTRDDGPTPIGTTPKSSFNLKNTFFEIGKRFDFQASSGFYLLLGVGQQTYKVDSRVSEGNDFISANVKYMSLAATAGFERVFWPKNWIGFLIQLEIQATRTLWNTDVSPTNGFSRGPYPKAGEEKPLSMLGASLIFGPVLSF